MIFYDKAFLRKMKGVVSVPYSHIAAIAAEDDSSPMKGGLWASSKLTLSTAHGQHTFEFRGAVQKCCTMTAGARRHHAPRRTPTAWRSSCPAG